MNYAWVFWQHRGPSKLSLFKNLFLSVCTELKRRSRRKKRRGGRGEGERITIINKHKNTNEVIIMKKKPLLN